MELDELNNSGNSQKQRQQTQSVLGDTPATSHQQLMPDKANASPSSTPPTPPEDSHKAEKNGEPKEALSEPAPTVAKSFQTQALPNGKTQTSVKSLMSKRKLSQQKEKKATQMLAIVLGMLLLT